MLTRRFDREEGSGRRVPFMSMLGPLGADDNKSQSYARMGEVVREIGSRPREMAISLDGVDDRAARAEAGRVVRVTRRWRDRAREMRIPRDEIHAMRGAFEHEELEQALRG